MTLPGRCSPLVAVASSGNVASRPEETSSARYVLWCTIRYEPPSCPYSLPIVLKQCGTGRHDRSLAHGVAIEGVDVARRQDLEDIVVAHPAGRIAGARLLLAEDREVHAGCVETGGHGPGDLLVARIEGRGTADPVEDLELVETAAASNVGDDRHVEGEPSRPVGPGARRLPPGIALVLHRPEGAGQLGREAALLEDEVAAQPDDLVDVLDEDRAGLHARPARHAVPDRVVRDGRVHDGPGEGDRRRMGVVEAVGLAHDRRVRDQVDAVLGLDRHLPDAHDEGLGVERLAGVPGRAGLLAAAAFGAGEPVEEVLPAEILERLEAERRRLVFEVHLRQLAARSELAQEDVREACRDVEVLAEGQVAEERGDQRDVGPPEGRKTRLEHLWRQRSKRDCQRVGHEGAADLAVARPPGRPGRTARWRPLRRSSRGSGARRG